MFAKEVKAFIHRNRVADVVNALNNAGFRNITTAPNMTAVKLRFMPRSRPQKEPMGR